MQVAIGFGGWVRASEIDALPAGTLVYVRFGRDAMLGRLVPEEIYLELPGGDRLRGEHLRRLPLDLIEAVANEDGGADVEAGARHAGPQLGILASHFATAWGTRRGELNRPHWAADAWWSQIEGTDVPAAPRGDAKRAVRREPAEAPPPLRPPADGRYSDDWSRHLAAAYRYAAEQWRRGAGEAPALALAAQAGVSANTVRSWVYRARKAGFLPKGEQGKVG